jgi:hypothetical protein
MRKILPVAAITIALPFVAYAQGENAISLWIYVMTLISSITKLIWLLTILAFLWGLVNFMRKADSEKERANAKQMMIGSVVAFFLAVSFWGLVTFAIKAFDLVPDNTGGSLPVARPD